jgi:uncharacterized membrane protein YdjX (TVP38/TMEM64 family)
VTPSRREVSAEPKEDDALDPGSDRPQLPLAEIATTLVGIALFAALVLAVPALRHSFLAAVHGDTAEVRRQVDSLGVGGPLLILALTLLHAVVFYPAEIVDAAAGFAFGFGPALALMTAGWLLSGLICFAIGHSVARPLLDRWLGPRRFERAEAMIERGGAPLLLAMRLIPIVPFSLFSYAAGAARVPVWRFAWTTAIGCLPITAIAVYLGSRLEGLSVTDPLVLGSAAALLALLGAGNWVARRQGAEQQPDSEPASKPACATGECRTEHGKDARRPNGGAIWPTEDAAGRSASGGARRARGF